MKEEGKSGEEEKEKKEGEDKEGEDKDKGEYIIKVHMIISFLVINAEIIKTNFSKKNIHTGPDINFCSDLPSRASEIRLSLAPLKPSPALEKCYVL